LVDTLSAAEQTASVLTQGFAFDYAGILRGVAEFVEGSF